MYFLCVFLWLIGFSSKFSAHTNKYITHSPVRWTYYIDCQNVYGLEKRKQTIERTNKAYDRVSMLAAYGFSYYFMFHHCVYLPLSNVYPMRIYTYVPVCLLACLQADYNMYIYIVSLYGLSQIHSQHSPMHCRCLQAQYTGYVCVCVWKNTLLIINPYGHMTCNDCWNSRRWKIITENSISILFDSKNKKQ